MANIKRANASSINNGVTPIADVPDAPTIGAVADAAAGGTVTVAYTAAVTGGTATTFTATSTPGTITGTGASPITVTGLTDSTAYTFKVKGTNSTATGPESAASSSVTPTPWIVGASYDSIATASGTGLSGTITFSSIPATYTHLEIRQLSRCTIGSSDCNLRFNGDTASNYSWHRPMFGNGSNAAAAAGATQTLIECPPIAYSGLAANVYGVSVISILDYANTSKYKTVRALGGHEDNTVVGALIMNTGNWRNTAAITSIELLTGGGSWTTDSRFALYGIKGA